MEPRPWFIKKTGFSERIAADDKATFMRICPDRRYPAGTPIFRQGDAATDLHVIAVGQVKLVTPTASGKERILAICGPDDFIGEAFLHDAERYRADAVALTEVVTCPMSRPQFLQMAHDAPTFVLAFSEILADHLFACREQLSYAYDPVRSRVAKVLAEQARAFGKALGEGWYRLETSLRHEEIASLTSATRVSVSMAIAEMREAGVLEGTRGSYTLNVPALGEFAEEG